MTSSTHTEEASCFTPRLSCSADTRTVGAEVNFLCDDDNQAKGTMLEKGFKYIELKPKKRNSCYILKEKRNDDIMYELLHMRCYDSYTEIQQFKVYGRKSISCKYILLKGLLMDTNKK